MVCESVERTKRSKLIRTHYEKMLSYLSNGEKLSEAVRTRKECREVTKRDRIVVDNALEFAERNVIYECEASSDDFKDNLIEVGIENGLVESERNIKRATEMVLSRMGVVPTDVWPYMPHPLCIISHLQDNMTKFNVLANSQVDFLLGFIKVREPFIDSTLYNTYSTHYMIPTLRYRMYNGEPSILEVMIGLEAPMEWFLGNEKRFKRPPFGNFSEPTEFSDFLLDMR